METLLPPTLPLLLLIFAAIAMPPGASAKWVKTYGRNRGNRGNQENTYNNQFEDLQEFERGYAAVRKDYYQRSDISNSLDELNKYSDDDFGTMGYDHQSEYNFEPFAKSTSFGYEDSQSLGSGLMKQGSSGYDTEMLVMPSKGGDQGYGSVDGGYGNGNGYGSGSRYGYGSLGGGVGYGDGYGTTQDIGARSVFGRTGSGNSGGGDVGGIYGNTKSVVADRYKPQQSRDNRYPESADGRNSFFN